MASNESRIAWNEDGKGGWHLEVAPGWGGRPYIMCSPRHLRDMADLMTVYHEAVIDKNEEIHKLKKALKREIQEVDDFYAEEMAALRQELVEWKDIAKSVRAMLDSD